MTRDETRRDLLVHTIHTVDDFIRARDEEHSRSNPGYEMGVSWADAGTLWAEFVQFQVEQLKK
jgi:hypothetical protein